MRSWLSSVNIEAQLSTVLGFAGRAVAPVVACIFGCFRSRDSHYQDEATVEDQNASPELFVSDRNQFEVGALVQDEEERWNLLFEEFDFRELMDEAKFLKACGTIPETPVEIRKASKEMIAMSAENGEEKPWSFKSWLPNAPIEKLNLENEAEESPSRSDSSLDSPNSSMIGDQIGSDSEQTDNFQDQNVMTPKADNGTRCFESSSALHTSLQRTQKSVRFDFSSHRSMFPSEGFSSDSSSQQSVSAECKRVSKEALSPYPTPLKLSDDMQTPGTVFPGYSTTRIRCQYVYSVPNPLEYHHSQLKELNSDLSSFTSVQELEVKGDETLASNPCTLMAGADVKNEVSKKMVNL